MKKRITRLRPGQQVNASLEVSELLRLAGVNPEGIDPAQANATLRPKLEKIFTETQRAFRSLLTRSSVEHGPYSNPYNKGVGDPSREESLYNSLTHTIRFRKDSKRRATVTFAIYVEGEAATYYDYIDQGHGPGDVPLSRVLEWAKQYLPGWKNIDLPGEEISGKEFFAKLREQEVNGLRADYMFSKLYLAAQERAYQGLDLTYNISRFAQAALDRFARGKLLDDREIDAVF